MGTSLLKSSRVSWLVRRAGDLLAVFVVSLLGVMPAMAGVGLGVTPTFPVSVNVGETYNLSLEIAWNNTGTQAGAATTVTGINLTPSCAQFTDSATCPSGFEDPNVWQINSPTTSVSGDCGAQLSFTFGAQNATTGRINISNGNAGGLIIPVDGTCVLNFTGTVLKLPVDGNDFLSGLQSVVLAGATGTVGVVSGSGSGSATVSFPALTTTPGPGGTLGGPPIVLSDAATILGLVPDVFGNPPFGTVTFRLFPPGDTTCTPGTEFGAQVRNLATTDCTINTTATVTTTTAIVNNGDTTIPVVSTAGFKPVGSAIIGGIDAISWTSKDATNLIGVTGVVFGGPYAAGEAVVQPPDYEVNCATTATADSGSFTANAAGIWHWTAVYSGDGENIPLASGCTDPLVGQVEPVTVSPPTPSIATDHNPKEGSVKFQDLTDFAILLTGFNPTGTITFTLYGPSDPTCTGSQIIFTSAPFAVPGVGIPVGPAVADKSLITFVGTYHWVASYSGDGNNLPVSSLCQDASPGEPVVITKPVLTIDKTPDIPGVGSVIVAGDTATFTIVVTNTSTTATAVAVQLNDQLPAGFTWSLAFTSDPTNPVNCGLGAGPLPLLVPGNTLSCGFGDLGPLAVRTVVVTAPTSPAQCPAGAGPNGGFVIDDSDNNPPATNAIATSSNADSVNNPGSIECETPVLRVEKTPDVPLAGSLITAGDTATFTIVLTNDGPGVAHNVVLTDTLPAGFTWSLVSTDPTNPVNCGLGAGPLPLLVPANALTCNFGDVAAGTSRTVVVTAPTSAALCPAGANDAKFVINDSDANAPATDAHVVASNAASVQNPGSIECQTPKITVDKIPDTTGQSGGLITAGNTATFTITITNNGPGTATPVTLTDSLPAGFVWTLAAQSKAGCTTAVGSVIVGNSLSCNFGSMLVGDVVTLTITAPTTTQQCQAAQVGGTGNGIINNNTAGGAIAIAGNGNTATNPGTIECVIPGTPELTIQKTPDGGSYQLGDTLTFTIVVTNIGDATAFNVNIPAPYDTLPNPNNDLVWALADPLNAPTCTGQSGAKGCSVVANVLSCSFGNLAPGGSCTVAVQAPTDPVTQPNDCVQNPGLLNTACVTADGLPTVCNDADLSCGGCPDVNPAAGNLNGCVILQSHAFKVSVTGPAGVLGGDICIGPGGKLSMSGDNFTTGDVRLDVGPPPATCAGCSIKHVHGVTFPDDLSVEIASCELHARENQLKTAQNPDGLFTTCGPLSVTKLTGTQTITGVSGINWICVDEVNVGNGQLITLAGPADADFRFVVSGKFKIQGKIKVSAPVLASKVLYNIIGTGADVSFTGGGGGPGCCKAEIDGSLTAISRKIALSPGLINGQVCGNLNMSFVSGSSVCPTP